MEKTVIVTSANTYKASQTIEDARNLPTNQSTQKLSSKPLIQTDANSAKKLSPTMALLLKAQQSYQVDHNTAKLFLTLTALMQKLEKRQKTIDNDLVKLTRQKHSISQEIEAIQAVLNSFAPTNP